MYRMAFRKMVRKKVSNAVPPAIHIFVPGVLKDHPRKSGGAFINMGTCL